MAKGIQYADFVTLDDIRALDIRQVLNVLGIEVDARTNKCICPIHDDTDPSMQVNEDYVYCHACGTGWDSIGLVQAYLRQRQNSHATLGQVKRWFIQQWDRFTAQPTPAHYKKHEYKGPVPREWVEYWHSMMSTERRQQLYKERLLTDDTIDLFRIGWRPDWQAWAIPFWRGSPAMSEADIMQFRMTRPGAVTKYCGLADHNRSSIMNADMLAVPNEHVIVVAHAFDPILARQDRIPMVGINGIGVFVGEKHRERLLQAFENQDCIYVVSDDTDSEKLVAERLIEVLGTERTFYRDFTGTGSKDYIEYRLAGKTPLDFYQEVLRIEPIGKVDSTLVDDLLSLLVVSDPYKLASTHWEYRGLGTVAADLARAMALRPPIKLLKRNWRIFQEDCRRVKDVRQFEEMYLKWTRVAYQMNGGW